MPKPKQPLTQHDIDLAIAKFERSLRSPGAKPKKPPTDDGKYLTIQFEPFPESEIPKIRDGEPIRIKTVFHAVELSFEDGYGSKFTCEYAVRPAVFGIAAQVAKSYPKYLVRDIEELAADLGISYKETKELLANQIARQTFIIRAKIGRFLHNELEKAIKLILNDLHLDAFAMGLSSYGYTLADSKDIEKTFGSYMRLRRGRIADVKHRGRPKGSKKFDPIEVEQMVVRVAEIEDRLEKKGSRITKNAIARGLYPQNSNALQQLNRFLTRYGISFTDLIGESRKTVRNRKKA